METIDEFKKDKEELEEKIKSLFTDFINKHGGHGEARFQILDERMSVKDSAGNYVPAKNLDFPYCRVELTIKI